MKFPFCQIYMITKVFLLTVKFLLNTIFSFYKYSTNNYVTLYKNNVFYLVKNDSINPARFECSPFEGRNYSTIYNSKITFGKIAIVSQYWIYFLVLFLYFIVKLVKIRKDKKEFDENEAYDRDDEKNAKTFQKYLSFDLIFDFFCCSSLFLISGNDYSKPCISNISQVPYDIAIVCGIFSFIVLIGIFQFVLFLQYVLKWNLLECCSCIKMKLLLIIASFFGLPFMVIIFVLNFYGTFVSIANNAITGINFINYLIHNHFKCCK